MHNSILNRWLNINQPCPLCDISQGTSSGPCTACREDLPYQQLGCDICALPGVTGRCKDCQRKAPPYKRIYAGFTYRFPLPQLLHRIKTGGDPEPLYWLAQLLAGKLAENIPKDTPLIPVPMYPIDQLIRGFNQSELLARHLARELNLPAPINLIGKRQRTAHQASLNRAQRRLNLQECFSLNTRPPERLILVDDVVTTGTTVNRIAELLLQAGAREVSVCTLCRTPE